MGRALASLLLLAASSASPAHAQATFDARAEFALATRAYEEGRFEDALGHFERCYEMTGEPDLLYNIATVQDRLRQDEAALASFRAYLEARPQAEDRAAVEARIRALEAALSRAPEPPTEEVAPVTPEPIAPAAPVAPTPPIAGIALTAGGGAVTIAGAILLGVALADIDAVMNADDWPSVRDAHERAPVLSGVGIAALAVGLATAGLGIALWATAGAETDVEVALGPGTVTVRGRL